jgi:hypothetical protein
LYLLLAFGFGEEEEHSPGGVMLSPDWVVEDPEPWPVTSLETELL